MLITYISQTHWSRNNYFIPGIQYANWGFLHSMHNGKYCYAGLQCFSK